MCVFACLRVYEYLCACACMCVYVCLLLYVRGTATEKERVIVCVVSSMGWLRSVGSLKLWASFTENSLFYKSLLQKRPIILRSLLIVATP